MNWDHTAVISLPTGKDVLYAQPENKLRPRAVVIGVGGGSLPLFLARHLDFEVEAVELDPAVLELAQEHFSFHNSDRLRV